jgi:hypothetical protein
LAPADSCLSESTSNSSKLCLLAFSELASNRDRKCDVEIPSTFNLSWKVRKLPPLLVRPKWPRASACVLEFATTAANVSNGVVQIMLLRLRLFGTLPKTDQTFGARRCTR